MVRGEGVVWAGEGWPCRGCAGPVSLFITVESVITRGIYWYFSLMAVIWVRNHWNRWRDLVLRRDLGSNPEAPLRDKVIACSFPFPHDIKVGTHRKGKKSCSR